MKSFRFINLACFAVVGTCLQSLPTFRRDSRLLDPPEYCRRYWKKAPPSIGTRRLFGAGAAAAAADDDDDDNEDASPLIDPLEQAKVSRTKYPQRKQPSKSIDIRQRNEDSSQHSSVTQIANMDRLEMPEAVITERVTRRQAEILNTLPLDYFLWFRSVAEQILPISALITVTAHVILLLPALQLLKSQYGVSIIPYLYLTPALVLVPYVTYWLWDNDIVKVPLIDKKLTDWAIGQRDYARETLSENLDTLMTRIREGSESGAQEAISKLAKLRLLAEIDVDTFVDEVRAIKKRAKGIKDPSALSTYTQSPSAKVLSEARAKSNAVNDVSNAVNALIETSLMDGNEDPKSLLKKLKQIEKDLDRKDS
jgi:hypothetical protein